MSYRAIVTFADLQDHKRLYHGGEKFPRDGFLVSDERLAQLASCDNLMGCPLIEKVEDEKESLVITAKDKTRKRKVKADA